MYLSTDPGFGQVTPAINIAKAVYNNRVYAQFLGWRKHYDAIVRFLGFPSRPTESEFAKGVARWQQAQGRKVDGMLGPDSWKAMKQASTQPASQTPASYPRQVDIAGRVCHQLFNFGFNEDELQPEHLDHINLIAKEIVNSHSTPQPVRTVYITGHTDQEGKPDYNLALGSRRARRVHENLKRALDRERPNMSSRVLILRASRGQKDIKAYPAGRNRRRVEVCLSITKLQPIQPRLKIKPELRADCIDDAKWQDLASKCDREFNQCRESNRSWYFNAMLNCGSDQECRKRVQSAAKNLERSCISGLMKCQQRAKYAARKKCP